jgi:hypothetical protein
MHGYLISNKGARKLTECNELKKITHGIDLALSDYIYNNDNFDFNMYALKNSLITQITDANNTDLVNNQHPIINSLLSKIKLNNSSLDLGYIAQCPLLSIRKWGVNINGLMIITAISGFFLGLYGSSDLIKTVFACVLILYFIEYVISGTKDIKIFLSEMFIIILFISIGAAFFQKG